MGVKALLCDLEKFASKEKEICSLTTLNEIITSNEEEIEFLYNSNGIDVVLAFLESDSKLANICLKILINASKRHKKNRSKLLERNIFHRLAVKLNNETDFRNTNLILYSTLIVVLLQENYEAQNQMRTSGCLASVLNILHCILVESYCKSLPSKSTELLIYAMISSNKEPINFENQTEMGWIIPKILEYLETQMPFGDSGQFHIIKCFWFLLKTLLDKNEINQQIFLNAYGLSVLFRSIQETDEREHCKENMELLVKITGVLVTLKTNKEFLHEASNYCPVKILCSLLKTCNSSVIQQTIIFLDSLTERFPEVLEIMRGNELLRRMRKVKTILMRKTEESYKDLWNRMKIYSQISQKSYSGHFGLTFKSFRETNFCVVHDAGPILDSQLAIEPFFNQTSSTESTENKDKDKNLGRIRLSGANLSFHRKELRDRDRKLRHIVTQNFSHSLEHNKNRFEIFHITGRKIKQIFHKLMSFFIVNQTDDFKNRSPSLI